MVLRPMVESVAKRANEDLHLSRLDMVDDARFQGGLRRPLIRTARTAGYSNTARALGLTFQLDEMDHSKPNWRSSDMSMDQLQQRMREPALTGAGLFGMMAATDHRRLAGLVLE